MLFRKTFTDGVSVFSEHCIIHYTPIRLARFGRLPAPESPNYMLGLNPQTWRLGQGSPGQMLDAAAAADRKCWRNSILISIYATCVSDNQEEGVV